MLDRYLFVALLRGGIPVVLLLMGLFGFLELAEQSRMSAKDLIRPTTRCVWPLCTCRVC
ncbi:MAG: hypothetical protein R3E84_16175 [Pseudomonadales bacterium]